MAIGPALGALYPYLLVELKVGGSSPDTPWKHIWTHMMGVKANSCLMLGDVDCNS